MKIVVIGGSGLIGTKLVPGDNARLGAIRCEDWLRQSKAA